MIRVGTCSWTDRTLIDSTAFYPHVRMSAEERLRFYAGQFNTVEVDCTYYALPSERMVSLQVERTPDDFILHYKAFALMTKHRFDPRKLPKTIRNGLPTNISDLSFIDVRSMPVSMTDLAWKMFDSALRPAYSAGKLGVVVFQFPSYFTFGEENFDYMIECRRRLPDYRLAVEFRHDSWVKGNRFERTQDFLKAQGLAYVGVDEPQIEKCATMPPVSTATTDVAYIRFHGRNRDNWTKKGITAAERFRYLYDDRELSEWLPKIRKLSEMAQDTFVMMNNCFQDYAIKNARRISEMLKL